MKPRDFDILDNMQEIVMIEDGVGNLKYVNKAFCKCHGVAAEDAVGRSCFDFILPEDRETCNVEQVVTLEKPDYRIEGRSKRADGKIIWLQYIGRAYFDEQGKRTEFQEIGIDITQWKEKIEESARELEKSKAMLLDLRASPPTRERPFGKDSFSGKFIALHKFSDIYTANTKMKVLAAYAESVAAGNVAVLIEGESGTGKELFAQAIHNASKRANGPFVAVNCGVIPAELVGSEFFGYAEGAFTGASKGGKPGTFELASGGTLFLDEIGEMPLAQQVALLRVLETKTVSRIGADKVIPVDVRIVCATNKDLYQESKQGRFRSDLYYRLNVVNLRIPPLRERKEDIFLLVGAFIKKYGSDRFDKEKSFSDEKLIALYNHDWPGNVRELQNMVQRLMYIPAGDMDQFFDQIAHAQKPPNPSCVTEQEDERGQLARLMKDYEGNISLVARKMQISRNTIYKKLKKYNIERSY